MKYVIWPTERESECERELAKTLRMNKHGSKIDCYKVSTKDKIHSNKKLIEEFNGAKMIY